MNEIQFTEGKLVRGEYDVEMGVVEDVENKSPYETHRIGNSRPRFFSVGSRIDTNRRSLSQFVATTLPNQNANRNTVFEKHDNFYDVCVCMDKGSLCAKIDVRDNFIIQDLLDEISPDVERLTIKGCGSQHELFEPISLDFSGFERLTSLTCNKIFNLSYMINLPSSLLELDCSYTGIEDLDDLPKALKMLICSFTNVTELDNLPQGLEILICSDNKIVSLDCLPERLQLLNCSRTKLRELCHLPAGLRNLDCKDNEIILIDNIPPNLYFMDVSSNPIIHLRNIPETLSFFYCQDCDRLSAIGNMPVGLQVLLCDGTDLRYLDLSTCIYLQRLVCNMELLKHIIFCDPVNFSYYHGYNKRAICVILRNIGQNLMRVFVGLEY